MPSSASPIHPSGRLLGMELAGDAGLDQAETFLRQFVLSEQALPVPEGWQTGQVGDWRYHHCPRLGHSLLTTPDGSTAGIVIGLALTPDGRVLNPVEPLASAELGAAEAWIETLSGRFVVLIALQDQTRFYVDPSCGLVAFHEAASRRVSSCLTLALDRPVEDNPWLPAAQYRAAPYQFYLFGETPDAGARRMLANHFLDLSDFTVHRHYPRDDFDPRPERDLSAMLDEMAALAQAQMRGLITGFRCAFPLTGGSDSRLLLAMSRDVLSEVGCFYTHVINYQSGLDSVLAGRLAETLALPRAVLNVMRPAIAARCDAERVQTLHKMVKIRSAGEVSFTDESLRADDLAPEADLLLRGGIVEMTRANKWVRGIGQITPEVGLESMVRPRDIPDDYRAAALPRYAEWLDGLPEAARSRAIDFSHVELWMPALGNMAYGALQRHNMMNPFNSRRLIELTAQIPLAARLKMRPQIYLLRNYLPEAKDVPYLKGFRRQLRDELPEGFSPRNLLAYTGPSA